MRVSSPRVKYPHAPCPMWFVSPSLNPLQHILTLAKPAKSSSSMTAGQMGFYGQSKQQQLDVTPFVPAGTTLSDRFKAYQSFLLTSNPASTTTTTATVGHALHQHQMTVPSTYPPASLSPWAAWSAPVVGAQPPPSTQPMHGNRLEDHPHSTSSTTRSKKRRSPSSKSSGPVDPRPSTRNTSPRHTADRSTNRRPVPPKTSAKVTSSVSVMDRLGKTLHERLGPASTLEARLGPVGGVGKVTSGPTARKGRPGGQESKKVGMKNHVH